GARQGEVRQAQWKEFDIEHMIWEVPWQHLKMGYKHHTDLSRPITKEMLAILEEMQARRTDQSPDALVFLSPRGRAFNDTAPHSFFRFSFKWDATPFDIHGFRSTLVDWCRKRKYTRELFDRQFDHVLGNRTGQSYGHDILLEERRQMIAEWCRYCSEPAPEPQSETDNVVNLSFERRSQCA